MTESPGPPKSKSKRRQHQDPKMIGFWKLGKTIGEGSSGRVRLARHTRTGQYAAIKIVSKKALISSRMSMSRKGEQEAKILLSIEREIVLMKLIDHPNIISLYDVWETSTELYLILEFVPNGELFEHLVKKGRLPMEEALQYFQQIISAVDYCHRFNIAHRDLKPENLLLDSDNNIKVADFGMAAWEGGDNMLETSCGSPHYASPEVVRGETYRGYKSDIWSCGVILYALLVGRLPFDDQKISRLLEKVKKGDFSMPRDIPLAAQDLLSRMLEKDVDKRITIAQILVHPWFTCRPLKSIPGLVPNAPTLEEVNRPVMSVEDIDSDIFANIRTLWHGASESETIDRLMSKEKTWEKAVYHLLLKYRARRLEDYDEDEHAPTQTDPTPSASLDASDAMVPLISPTVWNETEPNLLSAQDSFIPLRIAQPNGPRAPPYKYTPTQDYPPFSPETVSEKLSLDQHGSPNNMSPISGLADFGDPYMQRLFMQILDRMSVVQPQPITPQIQSPTHILLETGEQPSKLVNFFAPLEDDGRFADAEEDYTSISDGSSAQGSVFSAATPNTYLSEISTPDPLEYGIGISDDRYNRKHTSWFGSPRHEPIHHLRHPTSSRPFSGPPGFPPSRMSHQRGKNSPIVLATPPFSHMSPILPPGRTRINVDSATGNFSSIGQPRTRQGLTGPQPIPRPSLKSNINQGERKSLGDKHVKIVLPGEEAHLERRSNSSDIETWSIISSVSYPSTEKASWFSNIFKFRPASFHLLSIHDATSSREECKRLLINMGVTLTVESTGNLKCRFDGLRDPAGVMADVKGVRFRIELRGVLHTHAVAGFTTSLTMILEKGALSTFKLLYNRLRREWELDAPVPPPKTPRTPGAHSPNTAGQVRISVVGA